MACSPGVEEPSEPRAAGAGVTPVVPAMNPYEVYLKLAPVRNFVLTPEQAQTRALLYCAGLKEGLVSKDPELDEILRQAYGYC